MSMLGEFLIDLLFELPFHFGGWPSDSECQCGGRLKDVKRAGGKHVECVTCERIWHIDKNRRRHLVREHELIETELNDK